MDDIEDSQEDTCVDQESFSIEDGDQDNGPELNGNHRTSTPTENRTFPDHEIAITNGQLPNQEAFLSLVSNSESEPNTLTQDQQSSSQEQTLLSFREYLTQENSGEKSQSLYTSALSNVNVTVTADSFGMAEGKNVDQNTQETKFHMTLCPENLSETSTQDTTWATAHGSFQDYSDLKDITIKQEQSYLSEESQDQFVDDSNNYKDDSVIRSGNFSQHLTESANEEIKSTVMYDQDLQHWRNGIKDGKEISDTTNNSEEMTSPDLDLLNEICEEATNMTIKEALIFSLNPGVRAGLREGRLSLNESEILALEQYCEKFIDDLISELLDGQWSEKINSEAHKQTQLDSKVKVAKKLSDLDLETLKLNCDRFVHSIITESLHDSCFAIHTKDTKPTELNLEQKQNSLDQNSIQDLLPIFKQSEAIQDYIGFLSADIVKSALAKLSTLESIETENDEKNEHMKLNNNTTSHGKTSIQGADYSSKGKQAFHGTNTNDMWKSHRNSTTSGDEENETNKDIEDNYELQYVRETEELSDDEQIFSTSLTGALETSLEFDQDIGVWEGGGLLTDLNSLDTERKQKIMLRELSFDEHADVAGTEVLAPVFLAIAEENDDDSEFQGMRKKAQSIENLCTVITENESPKQRSYSGPKKIIPPVQTDIKPEEDNSENGENSDSELNEGEYEGDESEIADDDDEQDNNETRAEENTPVKPQLEAGSSDNNRFRWHTVSVHGRDKILDLKLLEPYMKVISHGGYFSDTKSTIVVIAACYLPEKTVKNYDFLMEQLFFYVISTLELLAIHEDYYLVYLNGGTRQQNMPSVTWMKRFYQYIEGGLKRMKEMFIVHPNFRLKAVITLAKPLINSSFWRKLSFIHSLSTLSSHVPVDYIYIPDEVMRVDPTYRQMHNK